MEFESTTLLEANPRHMTAAVGAERVLLALDAESYHGLNAAGAFVWDLLQHPISPAHIAHLLHENFDVDLVAAEQDVLTFLRALAEQDLIRQADSS